MKIRRHRSVVWVGQAARVMHLDRPGDDADANAPDLAQVKTRAMIAAWAFSATLRTAKAASILDATRTVRLWCDAEAHVVEVLAIEVSYDGGRTFVNPLRRYEERPAAAASHAASPPVPAPP